MIYLRNLNKYGIYLDICVNIFNIKKLFKNQDETHIEK